MATDQEVAEARGRVAKLRAQLQGLKLGQGHDNLVEASNAIAVAALDEEAARLEAQVAAAKEAAKKSTVASGIAGMVQATKAARPPRRRGATGTTGATRTEGSEG